MINLSGQDISTLIIVKNSIDSYVQRLNQAKQAQSINRINQTGLVIDLTSTEAYIIRALHSAKRSLHFGEIIEHIEALGWVSYSRYHKFHYLAKVLRNNYYLFKRVAPATFTLRQAFANDAILEKPIAFKNRSNSPVPLIKDIVKKFVGKFNPSSLDELVDMMNYVGYNLTRGSIKHIVQNENIAL